MKVKIVLLFMVLGSVLMAQSSASSDSEKTTTYKMIDSLIIEKKNLEASYNQQGQQLENEELVLKREIELKQKRLEQIRDSKNQLIGVITILQEDIKALTEKKKQTLKSN